MSVQFATIQGRDIFRLEGLKYIVLHLVSIDNATA